MNLRKVLSPFLFLLVLSFTLVACDSNEAEDTEAEGEVSSVTTTTTVAASDPVVQEAAAQVQTTFADVVGNNVVVDPTPGAIVQTTTSSTSTSGASATTTATLAPLINTATGQPTGQVVVSVQSTGAATTTAIASVVSTNPSSLVVAVQGSSGAATTLPLDASLQPTTITTTSSSAAVQAGVSGMNEVSAQNENFASSVEAEPGRTWAQLITEAVGAGKGATEISLILARLQAAFYTVVENNVKEAIQQCAANVSAATTATVSQTNPFLFSEVYNCDSLVDVALTD